MDLNQTPSVSEISAVTTSETTVAYAGFGQRFLASLIDGFILGILNFALSFASSLAIIPLVNGGDESGAGLEVIVSLVV